MSIFLTESSKVVVQGMTGSEGQKHTRRMIASGTNIVGGVNPKKAGQSVDFDGTAVPVFGSVKEAMDETGADVSVVFVPPAGTKERRASRPSTPRCRWSSSSPRACRCTTPRTSSPTRRPRAPPG